MPETRLSPRKDTGKVHAPDPHFGGPRCRAKRVDGVLLADGDEQITCRMCLGLVRLEHWEVGGD